MGLRGPVVREAPGTTRQTVGDREWKKEINKQASPNPESWTLMGHTFNWAVFPAFRVLLM